MKHEIIVTDLTRMQRGMVCIAGYDDQHACFRPVLAPPGIPEASLLRKGEAQVFPFARVEFDFIRATPQPPHTEDFRYQPSSVRLVGRVTDAEGVLQWSLFPGVQDIFGQPVQFGPGHYVSDGTGARSLGTIRPPTPVEVIYAQEKSGEAWDYRIRFEDGHHKSYRLKVTDLTWQCHCASLQSAGLDAKSISQRLTQTLASATVYLRIGLSRGWTKFPDRCYLQINAVHTFPDYLEGRVFSDFARTGK